MKPRFPDQETRQESAHLSISRRVLRPGDRDASVQTMCVNVLTAIAGCGVLYFAKLLLVPIAIALLAYLSLRPIVAHICRSTIPQSLAGGQRGRFR
ncbi:hypothetical protein LOC67_16175 [Stieleria sp. JC731]|uniref:hypothetical protein n=1 Tax=Pirellulaceae TaxID=2691357 RepID=UPI001E360218|nr:hypothetical protein [Stieleria sp. JC731]MCC9602099.1 hypothetical protein [Stieleria sp. JC731]